MERASKLIRGLQLPGDTITLEELACAVWADAVGKKVAVHTRALKLVRTRLVVEVEDKIWRTQLMALCGQILHNLERSLGRGVVEELEFRVVAMRREPQRAASAWGAAGSGQGQDEASGIADPVLRSIYRASRKRALV